MGYRVSDEALTAFAELLRRGGKDASRIENNKSKTGSSGSQGSGWLFDEIAMFSTDAAATADGRMGIVMAGYRASAEGVETAVKVYRKQDDDAEADIDRHYPAVSGADRSKPAIPKGRELTPGSLFDEVSYVDVNVHHVDATDRIAEAEHEIKRWIDDKLEWISVYSWLDTALRQFFGINLRKEVVDLICGDWEGFAKDAQMWRKCGSAYESMADNADLYRNLNHFWEGNAADAAQVYFGKFAEAVRAEVPFYAEYMYQSYENIVDKIIESQNGVDMLIGAIVDTVSTLGFGSGGKLAKIASEVYDFVGLISDIWNACFNSISSIRAGLKEIEAGDQPPCLMEKLVYPNGQRSDDPATREDDSSKPRGYVHPGAKELR